MFRAQQIRLYDFQDHPNGDLQVAVDLRFRVAEERKGPVLDVLGAQFVIFQNATYRLFMPQIPHHTGGTVPAAHLQHGIGGAIGKLTRRLFDEALQPLDRGAAEFVWSEPDPQPIQENASAEVSNVRIIPIWNHPHLVALADICLEDAVTVKGAPLERQGNGLVLFMPADESHREVVHPLTQVLGERMVACCEIAHDRVCRRRDASQWLTRFRNGAYAREDRMS